MRTFTKIRQLLASDESLAEKFHTFEKGADKLFKIVFERLDTLEDKIPLHDPKRKKIGLQSK